MLNLVILVLASLAAYLAGTLAKARGSSPWLGGSTAAVLATFGISFFVDFSASGFRYAPYIAPLVIQLVLGAVCAYAGGAWAKSQGLSTWFWGSACALTTLVGVAALAAVIVFRRLNSGNSPTGSQQTSLWVVAFIAAGTLAGFVLGVMNRPVLAGMGQPPIDLAFSVFGSGGGYASQTNDFLANQMARMNANLARDYAAQFAQVLAIYSFFGAATGAVAAFLFHRRNATNPSSPASSRWQVLTEVDPDIAAAAAEARSLGAGYEARLAEKYLALNDKSYLPRLLEKLRESAAETTSTKDGGLGSVLGQIEFEHLPDGRVKITGGMGTGRVFSDLSSLKRYVGAE